MRKGIKGLVLLALVGGLAGCVSAGMPVGNRAVPQPAKAVEIDRYLGRWHELYRYEARFQKGCEAVTADYSRSPDGTIRVLNACHQGAVDGPVKTATGKAKVVEGSRGAKLRVSFFGPFYGDYWVLDHGDGYDWSIVGEPSGKFLWVLARAPRPSAEMRAMLRRRVEALGYDWALVRETRQ